jgi:hypothetical protein
MSTRPEIIPESPEFAGGCWSSDLHGIDDGVSGDRCRYPSGGRQDAKAVPVGRWAMAGTFRSPRGGRPAIHRSSDDYRPAIPACQHPSGVRPAFRRRPKPRHWHPASRFRPVSGSESPQTARAEKSSQLHGFQQVAWEYSTRQARPCS